MTQVKISLGNRKGHRVAVLLMDGLQIALGHPIPRKAKAAELLGIQRLSLVAGRGFEPLTFRL